MDASKRGEDKQEEAFVDDGPNDSPQDEQQALQGQSTSSQSMNSDVSNKQFAKRLSTMDENMANMTKILSQIWQQVDSGGKTAKAKKRQQEEQNSSESEQDEHTAKRRRPADENEDSLSVTASDDEVRQLLSDNDTPQQQHDDLPDDDLLQELELQFSEDKSLGPAVREKLATIAINRWTEKLSPDKIKEINEKYKQPLNCEAMRVSRINPEIWSQITQHKKKTDLRLSRVQQNVQKAVFATLQMAETLSAKNRPSALTDNKKGNEREALLRIAVNLIAMLGHVNVDVMSMRQESIKPALKPEFQKICHATVTPNSKFLFGDDLAKLVRDSKEINSIANTLTLTRTAYRNNSTSRRNAHTYNRDDNSYTGDNRGRNTTTKPFFYGEAKNRFANDPARKATGSRTNNYKRSKFN